MSKNPHTTKQQAVAEATTLSRLTLAEVMSAPSHDRGDNVTHTVEVRPWSSSSTTDAQVATTMAGDTHVPPEGSWVLVQDIVGTIPVVVRSVYLPDDDRSVPPYEPGERRIGHPASDAHVRLHTNGTIEVANGNGTSVTIDGDEIHLNGNGTGVVTDVTTTTDVDGHVTDITVKRSNTVKL